MNQVLLVEHPTPQIAILTMNRPEKRNALNVELIEALDQAVAAQVADPGCRVLILRGAGKVFCAGLDLQEAADSAVARRSGRALATLYHNLYRAPLVTIAAAHGAAIGGGTGLIAACDLAIVADDLRLGYPEVQRGLSPALILVLLRRRIAWRDLRELLFVGDMIDAAQVVRIGLANRAVPAAELARAAAEMATAACQGAPGAIARSKALMAEIDPIERELEAALRMHLEARDSEEGREGIAAFLEKRPPRWALRGV
jgi:methylglutaconyl-CoA hydratase